MDRNYIIYNNRAFTLIWHLAFGGSPRAARILLSALSQISHAVT